MSGEGIEMTNILGNPKAPVDALTSEFAQGRLTKSAFAMQVIFITLIIAIFFAGFIAVFFFYIASGVEKDVVKSSTLTFVSELLETMETFLPKSQVQKLKAILTNIKTPDFQKEDAKVKAKNDALKKKTTIILASAASAVAVIVIITYFSYKAYQSKQLGGKGVTGINWPDMSHVLAVAATCFGGVAIAEIAFLFLIGKNYKPLNGNTVKKAVIDDIIAKIKALPKPTVQTKHFIPESSELIA
jgi:hypothetical protein